MLLFFVVLFCNRKYYGNWGRQNKNKHWMIVVASRKLKKEIIIVVLWWNIWRDLSFKNDQVQVICMCHASNPSTFVCVFFALFISWSGKIHRFTASQLSYLLFKLQKQPIHEFVILIYYLFSSTFNSKEKQKLE